MCSPNLKSVYSFVLPVPEISNLAKLHTPNLEEGEAIGGLGWYYSKERCSVPISPPYILFLYQHSFVRNFRLQFFSGVANRTPNFGEGEAAGGRVWYHSKERF